MVVRQVDVIGVQLNTKSHQLGRNGRKSECVRGEQGIKVEISGGIIKQR